MLLFFSSFSLFLSLSPYLYSSFSSFNQNFASFLFFSFFSLLFHVVVFCRCQSWIVTFRSLLKKVCSFFFCVSFLLFFLPSSPLCSPLSFLVFLPFFLSPLRFFSHLYSFIFTAPIPLYLRVAIGTCFLRVYLFVFFWIFLPSFPQSLFFLFMKPEVMKHE